MILFIAKNCYRGGINSPRTVTGVELMHLLPYYPHYLFKKNYFYLKIFVQNPFLS